MRQIKTTEAVGHIICHDITQIIKDVVKDVAFRKGHVVTEADIPVLLSLGKDHLYVWEKDDTMFHENEAAQILYDICKNDNMKPTPIKEGKIELVAACEGLFCIDTQRLEEINMLEDIMIASRHTYSPVKEGDRLIGTRVIPLVIAKDKMTEAVKLAGNTPLAELIPYQKRKAGIVTTGSEVYYGRIQDTFTPVIKEKLSEYGISVVAHVTVNDDKQKITEAILKLREEGVELIVCTGGMSVDPDDLTPGAIRDTGAEIISYGAPVLPGAMFLIGYFEDGMPIMGLPGCVMYAKATIFDLVLPRVAAGVKVTKKDLVRLGHGGLCLGCKPCYYPNCGFGKGAY
ncbi:MAG: molybdopterin-binding protein [Cellulosilyticaceae bacterium]